MVTLPSIREELSLFPGSPALDGAPSWTIHDPARNRYFQIDWVSFEILKRWPLGDVRSILMSLKAQTPLAEVDATDVQAVLQFLKENQLLQSFSSGNFESLLSSAPKSRRQGWLAWLLHHYLFFRVPLFRPDALLDRFAPGLRWFASKAFLFLTIVACVLGLGMIIEQWDSFAGTFIDLLSPTGLVYYALTVMAVKFAHELGHAVSAKNLGCRVPTMGVAFLVLFPVAYTDVNDVWRLKGKRDRLAVGSAGILTELSIAAWAGLLWVLVPDGALRTSLFLLASTTWISTLAINALPFLRFDGYFLLMDWLSIPNLHARSFALGTWWVREAFFRLGAPVPEHFPRGIHRFLIAFALITWAYRLILFVGIAALVYGLFPAPLGLFLALVELSWFVMRPLGTEIFQWFALLRSSGSWAVRFKAFSALGALAFLLFFPWDARVIAPAMLLPADRFPLIAEDGGQILSWGAEGSSRVGPNEVLMEITQPDLAHRLVALEAKIASVRAQLRGAVLEAAQREEGLVLQADLNRLLAEKDELAGKISLGEISSPISGIVNWNDRSYRVGMWVGKKEHLGDVFSEVGVRVEALLSQREALRIAPGDQARFFFTSGSREPVALEVVSIDEDSVQDIAPSALAPLANSQVAVREQEDRLIPAEALYRVVLSAPEGSLGAEGVFQGKVSISGRPRAWASPYLQTFLATLRRELRF